MNIWIALIGTLLGALISAIGMWFAYGRSSKATIYSSNQMAKVNAKNTLLAQYNNLFERVNKLEDQKDTDSQEIENSLQDDISLWFIVKDLVFKLQQHNLSVEPETLRVLKNYGKKLKDDSRNSL